MHVIDAVLLPPAATGLFESPQAAREVTIFPNPAINQVRLSGIEGVSRGYVKIFDLNGAMVYSTYAGNLNDYINLGNINSGAYFLMVETSSGRYAQKLLVK